MVTGYFCTIRKNKIFQVAFTWCHRTSTQTKHIQYIIFATCCSRVARRIWANECTREY